MPGRVTGVGDLGSQYKSYIREECAYRPVASTTYLSGALLQMVSLDLELFTDNKCVQLSSTAATQQKLAGFVSETWPGFSGSVPPATFVTTANQSNIRGTQLIDAVLKGFHPGVLIDQSGAGGVTVTDGIPLISSRNSAGYVQGAAASSIPGSGIAVAALPASGIGSSLTAATLAQASQTDTLTGTPAVGDTLSVTIQSPYASVSPGVAQTTTWTTPPLTAAQAASVTTAATALAAYLNTQANFTKYFIATSSAGVVTVTVNALSAGFGVNFGTGSNEQSAFSISISGMVANSLTFAVSSTGGTTSTAGAATLTGGTGYKGTVPAWTQVLL